MLCIGMLPIGEGPNNYKKLSNYNKLCSLFVIAKDATFYILRASDLGPHVKGIALPNNEELINTQFADDACSWN